MKIGWQTKMLAEVCNIFADGDWVESKDQSPSGIRLIQTGNVGEGIFKDRSNKARYISEATFKRLRCTEIFEGDCLISRLPDPVGRSCILPNTGERMITAVDCTIVRFNLKELLPAFFNFYSQSLEYLKAVDFGTSGTTRNRISRNNLGVIPIPVPPLAEQLRIVRMLDEASEGVAIAKTNAKKNLQNVRALFESHLHVEHAEKAMLGDLVNIKTGKLDANAAVEGGKYPFFTCSREIFAINNYAFDSEAILLAGNNAVGDFNVKHYNGKFNAYQRTYIITVNEKKRVLCRFLYFQILKSLKKFKAQSVGVGTKFLKMGMIQGLEIELPSLDEQQRIVSKMDSVREETDHLAKIYERKLAGLEELKKSLLHQAFNGTLTPKSNRRVEDVVT
jgi:type I restriction enzyme, S subunit